MVSLDACTLLHGLTAEELESLRRAAREQHYAAGGEIFREGDAGDGLYVVGDGRVEISSVVGQGVRRVLSDVGPGEVFGEMAIVDNKPRSASAVAARETTVYFIPREAMETLAARSPALALALLREVSGRLRDFNRHYIREVLQTERLAAVGRFARSIIHDLKNPLNIIGLTADMAALEGAPRELRVQAQSRIRTQIDRITDLVNDILDFTSGTPSTAIPVMTDFRAFVQHVLDEARPELELRSVKIEIVDPIPKLTILAHPKRLRRVFSNLMHNAADAMSRGGTIRVRVSERDGAALTEIADTGPGIAPDIAEQLFETFATFGKAHGTGLGLSICKKIIEDHHGRIWARNEPTGAVFSFELPLVRESLNR
jgi:signal transduction histidine kinase